MSTTKTKTKRINFNNKLNNLLYEKLLTNDKTKLTINETDILNKRILELKQLTTVRIKTVYAYWCIWF